MNYSTQVSYDQDFYRWALHTADLLKTGQFLEVERKNLVEEIETIARHEKREFVNRLIILIAHLLKWKFKPDRRSNSWRFTIREQRNRLLTLLEDSPSLKCEL